MLKTASGGQEPWDVGGQWVGPTQHHLLDLLKELEVETYEQYTTGRKLAQIGSEQIRGYSDSLPSNSDLLQYSIWEGIDFLRFFAKSEWLAQKVRFSDPFASAEASDWDSMTVAEWTARNSWTTTLRDSAELVCRSVFGTSAAKMSMLYFLAYGNAGGAITNLLEAVGDGAQRYRIKGGSQQLSRMMADDLGGASVVRLNRAVWKIVQDSDGVQVFHLPSDGGEGQMEVIKCKKVIVAVPPQQAGKISYQPPLPETIHQLFNAFPQVSEFSRKRSCCQLVQSFRAICSSLSSPILGPSGGKRICLGKPSRLASPAKEERLDFFVSRPESQVDVLQLRPVSITFDGTTDSGAPALVGFYNSEWSERPLPERRAALLDDLARFFGPEARNYVDYLDKDWAAEPFSGFLDSLTAAAWRFERGAIPGGCPVGILPPGYMSGMARIREPINRIHWAGTESATVWTGYMSGALQSGLRAAAEVLTHLAPSAPIQDGDLDGSVYAPDYQPPLPKQLAYPKPRLITKKRLVYAAVIGALGYWAAKKAGFLNK